MENKGSTVEEVEKVDPRVSWLALILGSSFKGIIKEDKLKKQIFSDQCVGAIRSFLDTTESRVVFFYERGGNTIKFYYF